MPCLNRPSARSTRSTRSIPRAALVALALSLACHSVPARDWLSPSPDDAPAERHRGTQQERPVAPAPWAGLIWAGPQTGAPAVPQATDCRRAPERFEVEGPAGFRQRGGRVRPMGDAARSEIAGAADRSATPAMEKHAEAAAAPSTSVASRYLPMPPQPAPVRRPADEPVSAGVVDDNADFGEYLAYRQRAPQFARRELAVEQRVRLQVRDARGRAVPDAAVAVVAGGRAMPLWARTDAGGQVWLMPQPDMVGDLFEVQVSKGGATARVLWRRGQKDMLQARLDGASAQLARLDLVFVIDATGSMADEIDKLKRSMKSVADQIAGLPSRPDICFGLVAYRDRGDAFFVRGADFSNDLGAFQATLAQLQADGGGDFPEAMNEALHTAVHRLSWRGEGTARLLVLLADAPPHLDYGAPHYDHDLRGALARGIKVFSVGASGLDPQGQYVMRQAAQFTGGRFVFLTYAEANNPNSGPGRETTHDVRNYSVESLDKLVVRLVGEELAAWPGKP